MFNQIRPAIVLTVLLSAVTGLAYPFAITAAAQAAFPSQANGSRIERAGVTIGSDLIGQNFQTPGYFWPRPSATGPAPYNAAASSGSNLGPTDQRLVERAASAVAATGQSIVPADAVTTSGSGLDPHISPQYAVMQIARVASARRMEISRLETMVHDVTEQPILGIFGEPRVNVLRLNLSLDQAAHSGN